MQVFRLHFNFKLMVFNKTHWLNQTSEAVRQAGEAVHNIHFTKLNILQINKE